MRRSVQSVLGLAICAVAAACATASRGVSAPDAVARLERARAANPTSAPVARALGIAYYQAGRFAEASGVLTSATQLDPRDGTSALYLGMAAEQQDDLTAARAAYSTY